MFEQVLLTTRSYPSRIFKQYTSRAKIDEENIGVKYSPYWLRHTLGSTSDSPIQDISALYNHPSVKVTQKYSHRENLKTKLSVVSSYPTLTELKKEVKKENEKNDEEQYGSTFRGGNKMGAYMGADYIQINTT